MGVLGHSQTSADPQAHLQPTSGSVLVHDVVHAFGSECSAGQPIAICLMILGRLQLCWVSRRTGQWCGQHTDTRICARDFHDGATRAQDDGEAFAMRIGLIVFLSLIVAVPLGWLSSPMR